MAQRDYRIDLKGADFPLLSTNESRDVVSVFSEEVYHKQPNKPHVYYAHNIMPTEEGYVSVGYNSLIPAVASATAFIADARTVFCDCLTKVNLAWKSDGSAYMLRADGTWEVLTGHPVVGAGFSINDISVGTVNGISYICYKGLGVYTVNIPTAAFVPVVLTGLAIANVLCVVGSYGQLVAFTTTATAWSSLIDPSDFTPSQITGAGGGNVEGIHGDIIFAVEHIEGIMVFTESNTVFARYTGNRLYPYSFKEVPGSKGGISLDLTAYEANTQEHYVYTNAGLQQVTPQEAKPILPDVTDFLAGKKIEVFDEDAVVFSTSSIPSMKKKIKLIASRYLVISYGHTTFTHALLYDLALQQYGKLYHQHTDIFEYVGTQAEVAKESICLLMQTGEVKNIQFGGGTGVLVLGKIQFSRNKMTILLGADVENCNSGILYTLPSLDGKLKLSAIEGYLNIDGEQLKSWLFYYEAKNHTLVLIGDFEVNTIIATIAPGGRV